MSLPVWVRWTYNVFDKASSAGHKTPGINIRTTVRIAIFTTNSLFKIAKFTWEIAVEYRHLTSPYFGVNHLDVWSCYFDVLIHMTVAYSSTLFEKQYANVPLQRLLGRSFVTFQTLIKIIIHIIFLFSSVRRSWTHQTPHLFLGVILRSGKSIQQARPAIIPRIENSHGDGNFDIEKLFLYIIPAVCISYLAH